VSVRAFWRALLPAVACLAFAVAPAAATGATTLTVVNGSTLKNNTGPPTFRPTADDSEVGAALIDLQLQQGVDVTLRASTVDVEAAITSLTGTATLELDGESTVVVNGPLRLAGGLSLKTSGGDITATTAVSAASLAASDRHAIRDGTATLRGQLAILGSTTLDIQHVVDLSNPDNQFGGPVSVMADRASGSVTVAAGGDLSITSAVALYVGLSAARDLRATEIGVGSLNLASGGSTDVTGSNSFARLTIDAAGDASVADDWRTYLQGTVGGDLDISDAGAQIDDPLTVHGDLHVVGAFGQGATLQVDGATAIGPASGQSAWVQLGTPSNALKGPVSVTSDEVVLYDALPLTLGPSQIKYGATIGSRVSLSQTGPVEVGGITEIDATRARVTLTDPRNAFDAGIRGETGPASVAGRSLNLISLVVRGDAAFHAQEDLAGRFGLENGTLDATSAAGNVDLYMFYGGTHHVSLQGAGNVRLAAGSPLVLDRLDAGGAIDVDTDGGVTQTAPVHAGTGSRIAGGQGSVVLDDAGNELGDSIWLSTLGPYDVTARSPGPASIAGSIGGALSLTTTGDVTQSAPLTVVGPTAIDAGAGGVRLPHAANAFTGPVRVTAGQGETLRARQDLPLGTSAIGGDLHAVAGRQLVLTPEEAVSVAGAAVLEGAGVTAGANAAVRAGDPIALYANKRSADDIAPSATFNGSGFAPGPVYVASDRERWDVRPTDGVAADPFTFFYADADHTPPIAWIEEPFEGSAYRPGEGPGVRYECLDHESGISSCKGSQPVGAYLDTATEGEHTFTVTATDGAGNTQTVTSHYTVAYGTPTGDTLDAREGPDGTVALRASYDTGGVPGTYRFEYGPTADYGSEYPSPAGDLFASSSAGTYELTTYARLPSGTYHYRFVMMTRLGTVVGGDRTFTYDNPDLPPPPVAPPPTVLDASAQQIGPDAATLVGNISHYRLPTTYWFEYGLTPVLGTSTPEDTPLIGPVPIIAYARLTGLEPGTTYYFRLIARNANGTDAGDLQTFTTASPEPAGLPPVQVAPAPRPSVAMLAPTAHVDRRGHLALPLVVHGSSASWSGSVTVRTTAGLMLAARRDIALAGGRRARVHVTLSRAAMRRIHRATRHRLSASVTVKLRDRAGQRLTLQRAITLRAP
jgi:hypothetical protein